MSSSSAASFWQKLGVAATFLVVVLIGGTQLASTVRAATLLSDDFTGTVIDTDKWIETDPGGTSVSQNGTLSITGSYAGSIWGVTNLRSVETFSRTNFAVSANMSGGSAQLLGYGDPNFQTAGTAAYIIDIVGGSLYALAWENNILL